jgi:hypothetical protein
MRPLSLSKGSTPRLDKLSAHDGLALELARHLNMIRKPL